MCRRWYIVTQTLYHNYFITQNSIDRDLISFQLSPNEKYFAFSNHTTINWLINNCIQQPTVHLILIKSFLKNLSQSIMNWVIMVVSYSSIYRGNISCTRRSLALNQHTLSFINVVRFYYFSPFSTRTVQEKKTKRTNFDTFTKNNTIKQKKKTNQAL